MEPMTLGSPVSSPSSLGWGVGPPLSSLSLSSPTSPLPAPAPHPQQPSVTPLQPQLSSSGFLPGYLLGEPSLTATPGSPQPGPVSPCKRGTPSSLQLPPRGAQLLKENSRVARGSPSTEKSSGPPTTSLLSSLTPAKASPLPLPSSPYTPLRGAQPAQDSLVFPPPGSGHGSAVQEADHDAHGVPGTWVTVWGFPPSAASLVLEQLSACGAVLQHIMPPNSNWMHVRFQTRMQASKAVGKNGHVLGGSLMVGVRECREPGLGAEGQGDTSLLNTSLTSGSNSTPRTIRPLTQAYKETHSENKVVPGVSTPNKDSGLMGKAMGYMFGW